MSYTHSRSYTVTFADARRVGGKVAADLRQMSQEYNRPTAQEIEEYLGELTQLLMDGYLGTVTYGFKRDGVWLSATLRYTALSLTEGLDGDRSGSIQRGVDISGASWYSFLTYSQKWDDLSQEAQVAYKAKLPVQRTTADAPTARGAWIEDRSYISGVAAVQRAILRGAS